VRELFVNLIIPFSIKIKMDYYVTKKEKRFRTIFVKKERKKD
jgi:hypothetical protein